MIKIGTNKSTKLIANRLESHHKRTIDQALQSIQIIDRSKK